MGDRKILVIDDSNYQRNKLRKLLENNGYEVILAEDGVDGVYTFKKDSPDLVIMDINMPYMEGLEALVFIKRIDRNAIVIMFSTLDDEKVIMNAVKAGARDYVVKPLDERNMLETIGKYLKTGERMKS